jgi:hypothetical protein
VLLVITREDAGAGSGVGNRWVKWWRLHGLGPYEIHDLFVALRTPALKPGCVNDAGLAEAAPRSGA